MAAVRIDEAYHDVYLTLARDASDGGTRRAFSSMKDVFMLAFALGVKEGVRTPLKKGRDVFQQEMLRERDWDVIRCVAFALTNDNLQILENEPELLKIAQEFANTGVRVLKSRVQSSQVEQSVANAVLSALQ